MRGQTKLVVFFGGQIDNDQPIDTGFFGGFKEGIHALGIDRIVVPHQNDWRRVILFAESRGKCQRLVECHPAFKGALPCQLNGSTVGHWVGERQTQFDHVDASAGQAAHNLERCIKVWIAGHHIGHKGFLALGFQVSEFGVDTCHEGGLFTLPCCNAEYIAGNQSNSAGVPGGFSEKLSGKALF